jgi:release factor glutamine methyltransferase
MAAFTEVRMEASNTQQEEGRSKAGAGSGARAEGPWTVRALLGWIAGFLKDREVDSPRAVAEILLSDVLKTERLRLYMEPDRELEPEQLSALRALVARAGRHEPVQFLVGRWPFLGRDFEVAPCTLIPRPSTETLVERALGWYREFHRERGGVAVRALDLCTGTGCIAVSLALGMRAILRPDGVGCRPLEARGADSAANSAAAAVPVIQRGDATSPHAQGDAAPASVDAAARGASSEAIELVATDVVADAVSLARRNAARLGVAGAIDFRAGDLFAALAPDESFDLVVSNPPYVTDEEYAALDRNVREFEPASALRGGRDGLDFVRRIVAEAPRRVRRDGLLLVEIGWKHRESALRLVSSRDWRDTEVLKDCDGLDRVLVAQRA